MSSVLDAGRGATTRLQQSRMRWRTALLTPASAWVLLAGLLIATGALLYYETRGTTLWFDEWTWLLHRRADSLASYLDTHNGHLSLIPIAIYKLLFATAGIRSSAPYRVLVIIAHLSCCLLLFVYARRRVGAFLALVTTTVLLLFGPGWENLLWPFQITWLTSLGAGLGALLALDRHDRAGDLAACVLLIVSLASSGIGVPIVIGVILELALVRRRAATPGSSGSRCCCMRSGGSAISTQRSFATTSSLRRTSSTRPPAQRWPRSRGSAARRGLMGRGR